MMRRLLAVCLLTVICGFLSAPLRAHDSRPIYVEISEQTAARFTLHWKVPGSLPTAAWPEITMPATCVPDAPATSRGNDEATSFRTTYHCPGGLGGKTLSIHFPQGNPSLSTLVRVTLRSGETHSHIFPPGEEQWTLPRQQALLSVIWQYTKYGIEHIFAGVDHLLFVAALVFIARTRRRILLTITGFTLAHSITLALASLGVVTPAAPPVEASIALSIAFLAHEIVVDNRNSWTWRFPVLVSSSFGLLHGFGFASVLRDLGLPQGEELSALLFFNVGVEFGQLIFVSALAGAALGFARVFGRPVTALLDNRNIYITAGYLIGTTGSLWLIQRLFSFL